MPGPSVPTLHINRQVLCLSPTNHAPVVDTLCSDPWGMYKSHQYCQLKGHIRTIHTTNFYSCLLRRYNCPAFRLDVGHITCAYSKIQHERQEGWYEQPQNQLLHADQTEAGCSTSAGLHCGAYMLGSCCCQQHCRKLQRSM